MAPPRPRFRIGIDTSVLASSRAATAGPERALTGSRPVVFDGAPRETRIHDRPRPCPGDVIAGPAIVDEFGSTTVVFPGFRGEVDRFATLS